jgi:hypothetical protein
MLFEKTKTTGRVTTLFLLLREIKPIPYGISNQASLLMDNRDHYFEFQQLHKKIEERALRLALRFVARFRAERLQIAHLEG